MKQFLLDKDLDPTGGVEISGRDFHYLVRVRRLAVGEVFQARLPGGQEVELRVQDLGRDRLFARECLVDGSRLDISPEQAHNRDPLPRLVLFQALPKAPKMDLIVRQAAEAGADEIVPFCSEYSAPGGQRLERWERIIREARQQSGSAVETRIRQPAKFAEALAYWQDKWEKNGVGIMFHQTPLAENSLHEYLYKYPAAASAAVGPEGGFSPGETEAFIGAGFKPAFLGPGVLRAETAAITALAAIKIILMERWSWKLKISGI